MSELPYHSIPEPPGAVNGVSVLARLVDGIAFRYRWATEGLRAEDLAFRPCADSMTIGEVLDHVRMLATWVEGTVRGALEHEPDGIDDRRQPAENEVEQLRTETLELLRSLRAAFLEHGDGGIASVEITGSPKRGPQPFWSMINGPLADALTHVGQIASWRRMAGNPVPRADVFRGLPPS